jgi:hypothetical protein
MFSANQQLAIQQAAMLMPIDPNPRQPTDNTKLWKKRNRFSTFMALDRVSQLRHNQAARNRDRIRRSLIQTVRFSCIHFGQLLLDNSTVDV